MDSALSFIAQSAADKARFYCNVWLHVSHNKLDPTAEQKAAVSGKSTQCNTGELATNQTECAQLVFVAAQQDADAQIGRLWKLLGDLDLIESTLLLFSTDNGPEEQRVYSNAQGSQGPFRGRKRRYVHSSVLSGLIRDLLAAPSLCARLSEKAAWPADLAEWLLVHT